MSRLRGWLPAVAGVLALTVLGYVAWAFVSAPHAAPMAYVEAPAAVAEVRGTSLGTTERAPAAAQARAGGVQEPDPGWVTRTATAAGIPVPAMRAYARAQLARPDGCAIGWTTLAGVGWIESQHGTLGGRTLSGDGRPSTPIVGPALGALDHAYGPMQFIPSTWARWASDGDGDGRADIDDLDDAAMTAMRYLCGSGYDLATGQGWSQAIFAYNHSQEYVDNVYAAAQTYARRTS